MLTIGTLVRRHAKTRPNQEAYVDSDKRITWAQLQHRTDKLGHALRDFGVKLGDRVGIVSSDSVAVAETFIACAKVGAIRVGISGRLAAREIAHLIDDAALSVLFVQKQYDSRVTEALSLSKSAPILVVLDGPPTLPQAISYESLISRFNASPALEETPAERLMIAYTTGSTGMPKGAVYRHQAFLQSLFAIALAEGADHDDVWLHAMPASGIPVMHLLRNLSHGSKCAILGDWSAEAALQLIEKEKTTITVLVPTMLASLLDSGLLQQYDTSSMRQLGYGAAPIPPATMREAVRAFGCDMLQMYGSTELMGMAMMLYPSDHERALTTDHVQILSSAGRPLPYVDIKIVDDSGAELPAGETGQLLISSPYLIEEYWQNQAQFQETVIDGWLHTGDMAKVDAEGYLYLGDRAKFRIKTGGYNVYPTEVENVVAEHPAVREVCVVGLPDPVWGERIHAVISLRANTSVTEEELRDYCRGKIASFKIPKTIEVWPEIPKGVTGKILKREIIDRCTAST